jgi:hypothetical protein
MFFMACKFEFGWTIEVPDDDAAAASRIDMGQFCTTALAMTGYSREITSSRNCPTDDAAL